MSSPCIRPCPSSKSCFGECPAAETVSVVKTRMQQSSVRYASSLDCFVRSLRDEGALVFWRGASPRVARLVVSGTVTFVIYENVLKLLHEAS